MFYDAAVDAVWERWDLVCMEPEGCDVLVRVLRAIAWSYVGIALLIFYVAIRAWTRGLPTAAGMAVAALGSFIVVSVGRSWVASSGSVRTLAIITGLGLLAAWIGRPSFTERSREPDAELSEEAEPTSATH